MNNTPELFHLSDKGRGERIVNHYYADNCPRRRSHYDVMGRAQLEYAEPQFPACQNIARDFFQIMNNRSFISTELCVLSGKARLAG